MKIEYAVLLIGGLTIGAILLVGLGKKHIWLRFCMGLVLIAIMLLIALNAPSQTLLRREPGRVVETCPEHIALTRHWLKEAAEVSTIAWQRRMLLKAYQDSFDDRHIEAACQDNKTRAEYDWALGGIQLQMAYDLEDRKKTLRKETKHDAF